MTADTTEEPRDYLIRKGAFWYRPNKQGYTSEVVAAGRYTRADAECEASTEPWNMKAVPLSDFRRSSPEVIAYVEHLRSLGFTVTPPKDLLV